MLEAWLSWLDNHTSLWLSPWGSDLLRPKRGLRTLDLFGCSRRPPGSKLHNFTRSLEALRCSDSGQLSLGLWGVSLRHSWATHEVWVSKDWCFPLMFPILDGKIRTVMACGLSEEWRFIYTAELYREWYSPVSQFWSKILQRPYTLPQIPPALPPLALYTLQTHSPGLQLSLVNLDPQRARTRSVSSLGTTEEFSRERPEHKPRLIPPDPCQNISCAALGILKISAPG